MKTPSFTEIQKAVKKPGEKRITLNAGLDPREGKYHETACNQCFAHFALQDAKQFKWVCPHCKGSIKKGVKDRILELADQENGSHPAFRPPYLHLLPLAEIIQQALKVENVLAKSVQSKWKDFVECFENEITVLVDAPEAELVEFDSKVGQYIQAFRKGWVHFLPGGGGEYGKPFVCLTEKEFEENKNSLKELATKKNVFKGQKTLSEFSN